MATLVKYKCKSFIKLTPGCTIAVGKIVAGRLVSEISDLFLVKECYLTLSIYLFDIVNLSGILYWNTQVKLLSMA